MRGVIRSKGICGVCGNKFIEIPRLGYICPEDKTVPRRFYVDLHHQGKRIRIFSDKQGLPLDSYQRSLNLRSHINYEIKSFSFDPSKYVKQEAEKFYIATLLNRFLTDMIKGIAPSYKNHYNRYVQVAQEFFGATDVRDLKKIDLVSYKEHLEKRPNCSPKTIKNFLDNFKTFLRYVKFDLELIDIVPGFPAVEAPKPETHWLSADVQQKAIGFVPEEAKPIIAFLMLHGCRPGEARALKCKDVNLDDGVIIVSATFSGEVYRQKRKGRGARAVSVPIHPEIFGFIKNRVQGNLQNAYLFVDSKTHEHYSQNKLRRIWEVVRKRTGLAKSVRLYDATRHSVASQLINLGVPLLRVSRLLEHSSISMTEKYTKPDLEKLKIDISKLSLENKTVTKLSPYGKGDCVSVINTAT